MVMMANVIYSDGILTAGNNPYLLSSNLGRQLSNWLASLHSTGHGSICKVQNAFPSVEFPKS